MRHIRHLPVSTGVAPRLVGLASLVLAAGITASCTSGAEPEAGVSGTGRASASGALQSRSEPLLPPPGDQPLPEDTGDRLQDVIDEWVADGNNIGITAAVVTAGGTWAGAAGVDGAGVELVPESAMAIGSVTKTFVAAEVMRLVGEGRINLDAPVTDYVPVSFDARGATVRQVLGMRAGFPMDQVLQVRETAAEDLDRSWSIADSLAFVEPHGPRDVLGSFTYNNVNYWVLGQMLEQVTGEPLATSLTRDLIEPAQLERIWVQDAQQPRPPLALSEELPTLDTVDDDGPWLPSRSIASAATGPGDIAADSPSIARWGYLLYGGHVIDSALVTQMTEGEAAGEGWWYGLGTEGEVQDGQLLVGHNGDIWTYHGVLRVAMEEGVSIAVHVPAPPRDESILDVPALLREALSKS